MFEADNVIVLKKTQSVTKAALLAAIEKLCLYQ